MPLRVILLLTEKMAPKRDQNVTVPISVSNNSHCPERQSGVHNLRQILDYLGTAIVCRSHDAKLHYRQGTHVSPPCTITVILRVPVEGGFGDNGESGALENSAPCLQSPAEWARGVLHAHAHSKHNILSRPRYGVCSARNSLLVLV